MKYRRVFVSAEEVSAGEIVFSRDHSHYLRDVLRLRSGAEIRAICGQTEYLVRLNDLERASVRGEIVDTRGLPVPSETPVVLAFACVRPGPMEEILRHCTELGVVRFIPLLTRRTTRRPPSSKDRWKTIVDSACTQCGRSLVPEVEDPVSLEQLLKRDQGEACKIILSMSSLSRPLLTVLQEKLPETLVLMIGPEGGFDESEEKMAIGEGFIPVSLTGAVLRTETACIISAGVLACLLHRASPGEIP